MVSEIHSMIKVEVSKDRARLVTEFGDDKQFTKETRMMVIFFRNFIHPYFSNFSYEFALLL